MLEELLYPPETLPSFSYDEAFLPLFFKERELSYLRYLSTGEGLFCEYSSIQDIDTLVALSRKAEAVFITSAFLNTVFG